VLSGLQLRLLRLGNRIISHGILITSCMPDGRLWQRRWCRCRWRIVNAVADVHILARSPVPYRCPALGRPLAQIERPLPQNAARRVPMSHFILWAPQTYGWPLMIAFQRLIILQRRSVPVTTQIGMAAPMREQTSRLRPLGNGSLGAVIAAPFRLAKPSAMAPSGASQRDRHLCHLRRQEVTP
jgi:hypothetical protein